MELAYKLTRATRVKKCEVINRCQMSKIKEVYDMLDNVHKALFEQSAFGSLLDVKEIKPCQIVHHLLMRLLRNKTKDVENEENPDDGVWFKVNDKALRFGEKEFSIVTGFLVGVDDRKIDKVNGKESKLVKRYFQNMKIIKRKELFNVFVGNVDSAVDRYKLGLLVIVSYVLMGLGESTPLEFWWFELVDDFKAFNRYPWGSASYKNTIKIFQRDMSSWFNDDKVTISYAVYGFPIALMVWAFEVIPSLGDLGSLINKNAIPRMLKWEVSKYIQSLSIEGVLESKKKVKVLSKLRPTEMERLRFSCVAFSDDEELETDDIHIDEEKEEEEFEEVNVGEQMDYNKLKNIVRTVVREEIVSVVKEENKRIYGMLDNIKCMLDMLVGKQSQPVGGEDANIFCETDNKGKNKVDDEVLEKGKEDESGVETEKNKTVDRKENDSGEGSSGIKDDFPEKKVDEEKLSEKNVDVEELSKMDVEIVSLPMLRLKGHKIVVKRGCCDDQPVVVKRRKIEKVDAFDPYREIDPELMAFVEDFIVNFDDSRIVRLIDDEVSAGTLKKVAKGECLTTNVLNSSLCLIRQRILAYPDAFEEGVGILDTYFTYYILLDYGRLTKLMKNQKFECSKSLLAYLDGNTPLLCKAWTQVNYLYVPVCENNHYFLMRIDFKGRKIWVYDSLPKRVRKSVFNRWVIPFCVIIPMLLRNYVHGYEEYSLKKLETEKVVGLPEQDNGTDCGMFLIKYLEFLTGKLDVKSLKVEKMSFWRMKLVGELLAWNLDP